MHSLIARILNSSSSDVSSYLISPTHRSEGRRVKVFGVHSNAAVEQLHREWTVGLQGGPSILELDRRYGPRWRSDRRSEIQFYSLRLEIIREISRISLCDSVSDITAVQRVQGRQDREKWSLDKVCKTLRLEAKQRGEKRA
jgi:hypothetical protein